MAIVIPFSDLYFQQMKSLVHTPDELKKEGYRLEGYWPDEIQGLRRCRDCLGMYLSCLHLLLVIEYTVCYLSDELLSGFNNSSNQNKKAEKEEQRWHTK